MDPTLIITGIQAILRAAQAGADLLGEHARDRKVFLPDLELPSGSRSIQLQSFLKDNQDLISSSPVLIAIWDEEREALKTTKEETVDAAYAVMLQLMAKDQLKREDKESNEADREAKMLAAGSMVEQWREERKPPNAAIRMALTLTDIGLEFVASDPSIFGIGSRGEKLIAAFATNMMTLIPDDVTAFGTKANIADRVMGIFLRSGLVALSDSASTVFKDDDIAKLVKGVTKPIIEALPDSIDKQIAYRDLVDILAGPSAEAALTLLAENTETYFGKGFANDKALGAVTTSLFESIKLTTHEGTIVDVFSELGLIRLYQAGLGVAVERPELFIGDGDSAKKELFRDFLSGTATTLRAHPRFKGPIGASLAAMAVETVGHNASTLLKLNPNEPWEKVALTALEQVTAGLSEALDNLDDSDSPKGALKAFSDEQLHELGRIVLSQLAKTPGMLGIQRSEVQSIVAGIAEAIAADDNLLLSADEWLKIAGVVAQKAAANPGRLFGISTDDQGGAVAVAVISSVLTTAGNAWSAGGRTDLPLLFGETLEAVIETVIEALAGNISGLTRNPKVIEQFLQQLLDDATENNRKYGSEGLLNVFRQLIGSVLASGNLPKPDEIASAIIA
jgi:hypothetical protein